MPYSSSLVIDLGLILFILVSIDCEMSGLGLSSVALCSNLFFMIQLIEFLSVSRIYDLPELGGPTITTPNLKLHVS